MNYVSREKYPVICKHAMFMISLFGSTYLCEQVFSRMKYTKSPTRSLLSDSHLKQCSSNFFHRDPFFRQIFSRPLKKDLYLESISDSAIFPQKSGCSPKKKKKKVFTSISSLISLFFSQNQGVL